MGHQCSLVVVGAEALQISRCGRADGRVLDASKWFRQVPTGNEGTAT